MIRDEGLAAYYDQLSLITRGPIWSAQRFQTIGRMLLGRYDVLIDRQRYTYPYRMEMKISAMGEAKALGAPVRDIDNYKLDIQGLLLDLESLHHEPLVEISLDPERNFQVRFLQDGVEIGRQNLRTVFTADSGLAVALLDVPREAVEQGYDQLWILPIDPEHSGGPPDDQQDVYILGHVRLIKN